MMKKMLTILLALLMLCAACTAMADAVFAFEKLTYEVNAGKSIKLQPILQGAEKPKGAQYVWTTSDKNIATVSSGTVSGKKGGTATITVQMQDGKKNVLYETSCQVKVLQPVKKIALELDKPATMIVSAQKVGNADFTYQLNPTVYPEDASNKELSYRTDRPDLVKVSSTGLVTSLFTTEGGTATIYIEAADGSGAKATQKIKCKPFDVTVETIEMTERGAYRLFMPTPATVPGVFLLPTIHVSGSGVWLENIELETFHEKWLPAKVEKHVAWFDIRPMKAGTYTLTLNTVPRYWAFDCTTKVTLKVSESAAYGEKAFPKLKYASAMKDPVGVTGQRVTLSGTFIESWKDENNSWCYLIATKKNGADQVIVRSPRYSKEIKFIKGDKLEVKGAFAKPLEEKTETGLTLYKLIVDAEMINNLCYNKKVYNVEMYNPAEANKPDSKKK